MAQQWHRRRTTLLATAGLGLAAYKLLQWWRQADLRGQVVLITGGSRGLGLALAKAFAHEGCRLVLCARDEQELAWTRQIVQATKRGDAERILTLPANLLELFHGVFPGTTTNILGMVNRLLPASHGANAVTPTRGMDAQQHLHSRTFTALTRLGHRAAQRYHQYHPATALHRPPPRSEETT